VHNEPLNERRKFILGMARGIGLAAMGGLVWSAYVGEAKSAPLILRPPGALREEDFLKTCIKCGLCVEACPYDTLRLAAPGDDNPLGTPFFVPKEIPCYMCEDIPCVPVCPTGALDSASVQSLKGGKPTWDIRKIDIGTAGVDVKSCIAYWGIQCDACYRSCPLLDEAIYLEYEKNERTGKHAFLKPVVNSDVCTGCGLCERACVTEKPAIFVQPKAVALGKVGDHYIKGWDEQDESRLENVHGETTRTELSKESALDSLNDTEGLY